MPWLGTTTHRFPYRSPHFFVCCRGVFRDHCVHRVPRTVNIRRISNDPHIGNILEISDVPEPRQHFHLLPRPGAIMGNSLLTQNLPGEEVWP